MEHDYNKTTQTGIGLVSDMIFRENEEFHVYNIDSGKIMDLTNGETPIASDPDSSAQFLLHIANEKIHPEDRDNYLHALSKENLVYLFANNIFDFHFEHRRLNAQNDYMYMDLILHLEQKAESSEILAYCYLKNVDKEKRLELFLKFKSEHDELTGLYNKETAKNIIEQKLNEFKSGELGAFLLFDIDNFKKVNEEFGQIFADTLLQDLAEKIKEIFGYESVMARFGGDDFAVFIPKMASENECVDKASKICDYISSSIALDQKVSISIGISLFPKNFRTFLELYGGAEAALNAAKRISKSKSNIMLFSNVAKAEEDEQARLRAQKINNDADTYSLDKTNKKGAYQYFVDHTMKYWIKTMIIVGVLTAVLIALEIIFFDSIRIIATNRLYLMAILTGLPILFLISTAAIFFNSNLKFRRLVYVDRVTLGNTRYLFEEGAKSYIRKGQNNYALIYSDIVNFTLLNERFGTKAGDQALKEFSAVITGCLDSDEITGRVIDDKFGILIKYDHDRTEVFDKLARISRLANRIGDTLDNNFGITVQFGVYFIENKNEDVAQYQNRAELALARCSMDAKLLFFVFDERLKSKMLREKELEAKMHDALFNHSYQIFYQPKVSASSGYVVGAEALVRWLDDDSLIMPGEFIELFERNGFITQLDVYIFTDVCKTLRRWMDEGRRLVPISINISKKSLAMPNFVAVYKRIMDKFRVDKRFVEFEITESMMVDDFERFTQIINKIHGMGCTCSIDDFGTGFSSLSLLKSANVDTVKIDRSFFLVGPTDEEDRRARAVIKGIVDIAKTLNMFIVAEGVEKPQHIQFLRDVHCDAIQSFAYFRPLPIIEFQRLLG